MNRFIVVEGCDYSGKSTAVRLIAEILKELDLPVTVHQDLGGTELSQTVRKLLTSNYQELSAIEQVLLVQFSREHGQRNIVLPALKRGDFVVSDRYIDSTLVYNIPTVSQETLFSRIRRCGLTLDTFFTIYLTANREVSLERAKASRSTDDSMDSLIMDNFNFYRAKYDRVMNDRKEFSEERFFNIENIGTEEQLKQNLRDVLAKIISLTK